MHALEGEKLSGDIERNSRWTIDSPDVRPPAARTNDVVKSRPCEAAHRVGDQAIAAYLVSRKGILIEQQRSMSAFGQMQGSHRACGSGADYDHLPRLIRRRRQITRFQFFDQI